VGSGSGSAWQREIAANATERILVNDKHITSHVMDIDVKQTSRWYIQNLDISQKQQPHIFIRRKMIRPANRTCVGWQHCPWKLSPIIKDTTRI
jgi:hypothetical protein